MWGIIITAALTIFFLTFGLLYKKGEDLDLKSRRLKGIKGSTPEQEKPRFSFKEMKARAEKKRQVKQRGVQINNSKKKMTAFDQELEMAGLSMTSMRFTLLRMGVGIVLALIMMVVCVKALALETGIAFLVGCIGLLAGLLVPKKLVRAKAAKKQGVYRDALPDMMDLLVVSVEAGLGFDAAIMRLSEKDHSPLMQELMRAITDIQRGMSKKEAYGNMAARCRVKELTSFLNSLVQAEQMGISIKSVLKTQSESLREERRQRAQEKALKAPVKMLIPMVIFIFPVIFIILLGPAILNIMESFG